MRSGLICAPNTEVNLSHEYSGLTGHPADMMEILTVDPQDGLGSQQG